MFFLSPWFSFLVWSLPGLFMPYLRKGFSESEIVMPSNENRLIHSQMTHRIPVAYSIRVKFVFLYATIFFLFTSCFASSHNLLHPCQDIFFNVIKVSFIYKINQFMHKRSTSQTLQIIMCINIFLMLICMFCYMHLELSFLIWSIVPQSFDV